MATHDLTGTACQNFGGRVKSTKFSTAMTVSVLLHLALLAVVMLERHSELAPATLVSVAPELPAGQGPAALPVTDAVPVEIERPTPPVPRQLAPLSPGDSVDHTRASKYDPKSARAHAVPASMARHDKEPSEARGLVNERNGGKPSSPRESSSDHPAPKGRAAAQQEPLAVIEHDAVAPSTPRAPINPGTLREAMQAAAANSASSGAAASIPMVRVDPRERNLDRAWSRAFAWAFATDRAFFSATPVGKARFVLQLNESGAIADVFWSEPKPSPRIKELVLRMVRLLSQNRFSAPIPGSDSPPRRGFEMIVTESRVEVPKPSSVSDSQVGDLWMLGAGETPTPSQPSHPSVIDVTGRKVSCALRILEPLPNSR